MINKFKSFAQAMLITGATVVATQVQAASHTTTNLVTVDNVQIALKVYSQGGLNTHDTALTAVANSYTTTDLLKALAAISGNAFSYASGDKLVTVNTYSNFVYGTAGTTNGTPAFSADLTNLSTANLAVNATNGTVLPIAVGSTTNSYIISNSVVIQINNSGGTLTTNTSFATLTNGLLSTNGVAFTNINLTPFSTTNGGHITSVVTITGSSNSPTSTNIVITEVSPATTSLFTNTDEFVAVLTPKTHDAAEQLIPVADWVGLENFGNTVYAEAGKDLTTSNFAGTNIAAQTIYGLGGIEIDTAYPTNTPTGYMNAQLQATGFAKTTTKLQNLTVGGNSKDSQVFQVIGSEVVNVDFGSSSGDYIGGTFTTNSQTISGGVTNNNKSVANSLGTNFVSGGFISASTNIVGTGTITMTYLSATTNITTDTNLPTNP